MNDQFCCCGAQAGYPHRPDCPRPCYNATDSQFEKWESEWLELLKRIEERTPKSVNPISPLNH